VIPDLTTTTFHGCKPTFPPLLFTDSAPTFTLPTAWSGSETCLDHDVGVADCHAITLSNLRYKVLCSIADLLKLTAIELLYGLELRYTEEGKPAGSPVRADNTQG
jgi:hypothetical protein